STDAPNSTMKRLIDPPTLCVLATLKSNSADSKGGNASLPPPRLSWYSLRASLTWQMTSSRGVWSSVGGLETVAAFATESHAGGALATGPVCAKPATQRASEEKNTENRSNILVFIASIGGPAAD